MLDLLQGVRGRPRAVRASHTRQRTRVQECARHRPHGVAIGPLGHHGGDTARAVYQLLQRCAHTVRRSLVLVRLSSDAAWTQISKACGTPWAPAIEMAALSASTAHRHLYRIVRRANESPNRGDRRATPRTVLRLTELTQRLLRLRPRGDADRRHSVVSAAAQGAGASPTCVPSPPPSCHQEFMMA
eukprot:COSAG01_NODE_4036_length_5414_cov_56.799812_6_plen_186_part_00